MVRCGLGCRIGAVGGIGSGLGESGSVRRKTAIDFVGRHMQKTERGAFPDSALIEIKSHRLEQFERAHDIGLDKG